MSAHRDIRLLGDIPRIHARERGSKPALLFEDRITTFADLQGNTNRVANALIGEGLQPQARIGYLGKNSDHYFEVLYGAAKANAVLVGINWRLAGPEIVYVLNDARAEVLFVGPEFSGVIGQIRHQLKTVRRVIAMEQPFDDWPAYETWRDAAGNTDPGVEVSRDDVAIQMYTSGTTGHPKGVMLPHKSIFALFEHDNGKSGPWFRWAEDDISFVGMPVFHIGGTGWAQHGLYNGATTVIHREYNPQDFLNAVESRKLSKVFLVPAAIQFAVQHPQARDTDFSSLKYILYGASPIPLDLLRQAMETFGCQFVQQYGMTETTGTAVYLPPEDHDPQGNKRMRGAGIPMPGTEVCIKGENNESLGPNQIGEICMRGPVLMKGYWNLPEATAKTIDSEGWLHSGDAGYLDEDGYLFVHDRVKDMIVSGGENIYPAEVESAIFGHPAVADIAVIGVPSDRWGEEVKAIIVLKEGQTATDRDILDHARRNIAGYKVPKSVDFVAALPRNPSGKILKKDLRAPYWQGRDRMIN